MFGSVSIASKKEELLWSKLR